MTVCAFSAWCVLFGQNLKHKNPERFHVLSQSLIECSGIVPQIGPHLNQNQLCDWQSGMKHDN
jgi:hypothetical protein